MSLKSFEKDIKVVRPDRIGEFLACTPELIGYLDHLLRSSKAGD